MKAFKLFLFIIVACNPANVKATNYYVSNSGFNSQTGLSPVLAFQTLQHAADVVIAGDTVFVANGTYTGFDFRDKNGTATKPIVFKALGNNVLINQCGPNRDDGINIENANYIVIDGFISNNMTGGGNGIRLANANSCVVRNCKCNNNAERGIFTAFTNDIIIEHNTCSNSIDEHGIYVSNSSDRPIIRYNECFGNSGCGIHLNGDLSMGDDGTISNAQIYGNMIHDNKQASAINLDGVQNPIIYNNLIYNNHNSQGIVLFQDDGAIVSSGAKIYNNTIIVPADGRWGILLQPGANVNTQIYNNIIINLHSFRGCIAVNSTSQLACNYNIVNNKMSNAGDGSTISLAQWQNLGFDGNSLLADNLSSIFENSASNDYHLKAGSQAIDKGTNIVNSVLSNDIEGRLRPGGSKYDIGAFEYGAVLSVIQPKTNQIRIWPNPASDYFTISYNNATADITRIELICINGRLLKTFKPTQFIDIASIPAGVYLLKILLSTNQTLQQKLVIK